MLTKNDFLRKYPNLRRLDDAYSIEGEKLGKIVDYNDDSLTIERGFFFPKDFTLRYDDIVDIKDDNAIINLEKSDLDNWKDEKYTGWQDYDKQNVEEQKYTSDTRMPLYEEELEAQKNSRKAGEVRMRKVVHTEMKTFTVPVTKEEVVVEQIPADEVKNLRPGEKAFKDEEVVMPIMEEDVELIKKQKLKGEMRLHKETRTEQEKVSGEVRKEDVDIKKDDQGRKAA